MSAVNHWNLPGLRNGGSADADLIERRERAALETPAVDGGTYVTTKIGGVDCLVAGDRKASRALLHLHGGGFRMGTPRTWINYATDLAQRTGSVVVVPDYRLAPEHPYPAAIHDAAAVYEELAATSSVFVGGDSAGGALAVSLAIAARDAGRSLPAGLVLLSPWLDLTVTAESYSVFDGADTMFSSIAANEAAEAYLQGLARDTSLASPLHANLTGLPEVLCFVGAEEVLVDDSIAFVTKASRVGVRHELHVVPTMPHIWPVIMLAAEQTEQARSAIARFLTK
ncbi:MAG: alpha/beta hydrolase [Actinomycetota bacterium]